MGQRRGAVLFEVMLGLSTFGVLAAASFRGMRAITAAVASGRQWSRMAAVAASTLTELESSFRLGAPFCVPPAGGSRAVQDIRVVWRVVANGAEVGIVVQVSAPVARRVLVDSVVTSFRCR